MKSTFGDYQFYELNNYHRGAFKNSGEITLLNDLINDLTDRLDSIHRPYIKATITGTHCIGNVDYTVTESSKVVGNNLFGVKVINQMYFKSISIVVRTIKTSIDGYYVMWNANIVGGQQQGELSSTSTKYGGVVGQYIIGRDVYTICFRSLNNSFYTPIPNTMPSNMNTDDLTTLINSGKLKPVTIQVPSLSKPVYVKGQLQTTLTWNNSIYAL